MASHKRIDIICPICSRERNIEERSFKIYNNPKCRSCVTRETWNVRPTQMAKNRKCVFCQAETTRVEKLDSNSNKFYFFPKTCSEKCLFAIKSRSGVLNGNLRASSGAWRGSKNPKYGKKPSHCKVFRHWINGKEYTFRSYWEAAFAEYLESQKMEWGFENLLLPLSGGKTFLCDFKVNETIFEVKGYWWDDAKEKWDQVKKEYPQYEFVLIQKEEMKNLGVLKRANQLKNRSL